VLIRPGESMAAPMAAGVEVHSADIADRSALESVLDGVDLVLHCAARTGPWGSEHEYKRTNVRGLETLVRTALAARVRRLVHVSSATVHGVDVHGAADEEAPFREEPNPYTRSKLAGERLLERMIRTEQAPVTIVRPGWIYGPRDAASFGRLARLIGDGKMVMAGTGRNNLPLIYVRDVARGMLLAGDAERAAGRCYLLVNDEPVTQRDFLGAIAAELRVAVPRRRIPYRLGLMLGSLAEAGGRLLRREEPPPVTRFGIQLLGGENRFDIARARREIGFAPVVDVAAGVRRSVEWFRQTSETAPASRLVRTAERTGGARA
jgi:nucleoside-diphosphate-sugar epimerase